MRESRFSEEQIIGVLHEQESGATTAEVCRRHVSITPDPAPKAELAGERGDARGFWAVMAQGQSYRQAVPA